MTEYGRRADDGFLRKLLKLLPLILAILAGVFGYGKLSARVDGHDQRFESADRMMQEIRTDIKELLKRVR